MKIGRREFILAAIGSGLIQSCRSAGVAVMAGAFVDAAKPLVIYHHGSSETEKVIKTDTKGGIIPALLKEGYVIASSFAHGNNWGNDAALEAYIQLYKHLSTQCVTSKICVLCQSMGGLSGLRMAISKQVPVCGWYGIYPCTNLADNFTKSVLFGGIISAYQITPTNPYTVATAGRDPQTISAADFPNIRYRASASYQDALVPRATNWDLMAAKLAGKVEASTLASTGDHGHGSHFSASDVLDFFARCVPVNSFDKEQSKQ